MNSTEKGRHETAHGQGGCRRGKSSFNMHDPALVFGELKLKAGDVFLDLGCGSGEYSLHAAGLIGEEGVVYALDRSESHITGLKSRADEESIENITAAAADITGQLPIDDAYVDVCLLATVLHIPDITRRAKDLCTEIRRVLKPDGRLAVIECHKKALPFGPPEHIRLFPAEVKGLITQCGFTVVSEVDLGYNYMIQFGVE
ncbi:MAG: methyltransferase domain-containing protein [Deltaproteobacteria bacterium]|nr:methyltransferase domain-containing protein [Candidatus Zymogenaceae bacterium]